MVINTYEIIKDGKVIKTIEGDWPTVAAKWQRQPGIYIRKRQKLIAPEFGADVLFSDCWTSGNPGKGGYRVVTHDKRVVVEKNFEQPHTNNWFELAGVGAAVKYLIANGGKIVYTDSFIVYQWIRKDPRRNTRERTDIMSMLNIIRSLIAKYNIEIRLWDTANWGQIPADFGRK